MQSSTMLKHEVLMVFTNPPYHIASLELYIPVCPTHKVFHCWFENSNRVFLNRFELFWWQIVFVYYYRCHSKFRTRSILLIIRKNGEVFIPQLVFSRSKLWYLHIDVQLSWLFFGHFKIFNKLSKIWVRCVYFIGLTSEWPFWFSIINAKLSRLLFCCLCLIQISIWIFFGHDSVPCCLDRASSIYTKDLLLISLGW